VTASIVEEALGLEAEDAPAWRERNMGELQGRTRVDLRENDPALFQAWRADPVDFQPAGGESYREHHARVGAALEELRGQEGEVWVFTHGGCVYAAIAIAAGRIFPEDRHFRAGNTSLTTLVATLEGWELERVSCSAHLDEPSDHAP
jgi:probable phosphoglycerate mutase